MNNIEKKENSNVETTRGYIYYTPEADVIESNEEYKLVFDLPGIDKDDIHVKVEKDVLTVTAESKKQPVDTYECLKDEMDYYAYQRSFNLNGVVDTEKINADYNNGTLSLTMPKREEKKSREIQIKIA